MFYSGRHSLSSIDSFCLLRLRLKLTREIMFHKRKAKVFKKRGKGAKILLLVIVVVIILFFINGIFKGLSLSKFISEPISNAPAIMGEKVKGGGVWDGKTKVNIAIATDPVLVVSVSQLEENIKILAISRDTYSEVPDGYGWYRLGATWGLGNLENPKRGGQLFAKSVTSMIGVPIDYYIVDKKNPFQNVDSASVLKSKESLLGIGGIFKILKSSKNIKNDLDTNFTLFDFYRLWWTARGYRFSTDNYLDLSGDYLEELVLPDGARGYVPKDGSFEILVTKVFEDPQIGKEGFEFSIENGTEVPGVGKRVEDMIENIGARVLALKNSENQVEKSKILVSEDLDVNSYSVSRVSKALGIVVEKSDKKENSDIVIIIGKDWTGP